MEFLRFTFVLLSCFSNKIHASKLEEFYTIKIGNDDSSASSVCHRPSTKGNSRNRLEVVHRHDRCGRDKSRVASFIQAPLNPTRGGDYMVRLGFGTPAQFMHLIMDTGSHISWIQCQPCSDQCYKQIDKIFIPGSSSSYAKITCTDRDCPHQLNDNSFVCGHPKDMCPYNVQYGDGSYTSGFMVKDTLTLTHTDAFKDFLFGCGQNNKGTSNFSGTAGILGLSRHPSSFFSQTSTSFRGRFSYFLPKNTYSPGYLTLGENITSNESNVTYTPLTTCPVELEYKYCMEITAITVGRTKLPISQSVFRDDVLGNHIDSGTMLTYLPRRAYKALRDEFKRQVDERAVPAYPYYDTCYYTAKLKSIKVPTIAFIFKGNAKVDIDPSGTLVAVNSSLSCLTFADNQNLGPVLIFGYSHQRNREVVYDVAGGRLGFGPLHGV